MPPPLYDVNIVLPVPACRVCHTQLERLLDLGVVCVSDFILPTSVDPLKAPLDLGVCPSCGLVQLRHTVSADRMFRHYWYRSGVNEAMVAELKDVAREVYALTYIGPMDTIIDVGANDGTLLKQFVSPIKIAFEPARNLYEELRPHADAVYSDYFPGQFSRQLLDRSVKVITSVAMFYDLHDPQAFVQEVDRLLTDNGVWIVQMQDLGQMVRATAFDNICHEHLCYYTPETFANLLKHTHLALARVERRAINGGSLRFYVTRRAQRLPLGGEYNVGPVELDEFAARVGDYRTQLQGIVQQAVDQYETLDAYGASTKGNTLLQYCGFDASVIRQIAERSPQKVGLVTGGTRIPIVNESTWREDPAAVTLMLIWQFKESVLKREAAYLERGSFLIPLSHVEVVTGAREKVS